MMSDIFYKKGDYNGKIFLNKDARIVSREQSKETPKIPNTIEICLLS
jgi:hypothetical protein